MHFEPLHEFNLPLLHAWLQRPHVAAWWQPTPALEELREDYFGADADPTEAFVAWHEGVPIGFIQCYATSTSWAPPTVPPC